MAYYLVECPPLLSIFQEEINNIVRIWPPIAFIRVPSELEPMSLIRHNKASVNLAIIATTNDLCISCRAGVLNWTTRHPKTKKRSSMPISEKCSSGYCCRLYGDRWNLKCICNLSAPTVRCELFLYSHDKIRDTFRCLQIYFPTLRILNRT